MQIRSAPVSDGVRWVTDGAKLFARQPLGLAAMTVVYLFMHVPALIPVVGPIAAALLSPFATVGLMSAFRQVANRRMPTPLVFAAPFQNADMRRRLLQLGVAYAVMLVVVGLALAAVGAGESTIAASPASSPVAAEWDDIAWQLLLLLPVALLMWFAPMLAGWHEAGPGKALFGSAVACWRNKGAMLMYLLAASAVAAAAAMVTGALIDASGMSKEAASQLFAPVLLVLATLIQSGTFVMYETILGGDTDPR
jgi:hypothetical protein